MRRILLTIILLFLIFNYVTGNCYACDLQLSPASFSVVPGGIVSFHLERTRSSGQCPESPETASINVTGGGLHSSGGWKTAGKDLLEFKVKFNGTEVPSVGVKFNCHVTGLTSAIAKGVINTSSNNNPANSPNLSSIKTPAAVSDKKPSMPLPSVNTLDSGTVKEEPLNMNPGNGQDTFEILVNQISIIWSTSPLGLKIWYIFLLTGLLFYFLKLKQLRKPLLFLSIIVLGFMMNDFANPNPVIFQLFANEINYHTVLPFLLIPVIISLFLGRFFCGWTCPVGAIQEFISPDEKKRLLPVSVDRILKYLKYILLILLIYFLVINHKELWSNYDPFKTLFSFKGTFMSTVFLTLILLISIIIERPFCRYICPMGAILSVTSRITPFKMRTDADKCMVCGRCTAGDCPMEAISAFNPEVDLPTVSSAECIYCFRCQKQCRKNSLQVTGFRIDHVSSAIGKSEGK